MCDTAEDMDDFIEFELTRDCIEIDYDGGGNEEFLSSDYVIAEEHDDEDEQITSHHNAHLLDIKSELLESSSSSQQEILAPKAERHENEGNEQHQQQLIDDTNGYDDVQDFEYERLEQEVEDEEEEEEAIIPDNIVVKSKQEIIKGEIEDDDEQQQEEDKEKQQPTGSHRRYLLFDELVASIVDYDPDGTPIVEFSISNVQTDEKLPVECGICPEIMPRPKIAKHLKSHLVPGTNRYQCMYCDETYKDCKYLAGHARRHMGIRPYVCEICKLYFSTKQDLRVHNQRRHQEKDHICEVCGKTFAQNTQLKRHREATHEKKRRFKCDHCPKSYYKNFSLQEHVRAVHMGKRRMIVCPFCGMQCRDAHKMARHRKQMHLHQTQFECHICNEEFTDINYFDAHKRSIQCRNNTRRKMEEDALLQAQNEEREEVNEQQEQQQHQMESRMEIIRQEDEEESADQYIDPFEDDEDDVDDPQQTVQILSSSDFKQLIPHHQQSGQFILNNQIQSHKIEILDAEDDVAGDEELVYEITIDTYTHFCIVNQQLVLKMVKKNIRIFVDIMSNVEHVFTNILLDFINEHDVIGYDIISELNKFDLYIKGRMHPCLSRNMERGMNEALSNVQCLEDANNSDAILLEYADYSWNCHDQPIYVCKLCSQGDTEDNRPEFTNLDQFLWHFSQCHGEELRKISLDRQSAKLWITELERIRKFKYKHHSEEFLKEIDEILGHDDFDTTSILNNLNIHEKTNEVNDHVQETSDSSPTDLSKTAATEIVETVQTISTKTIGGGKPIKKKKKRTSGKCDICNRTFNDLYNLRIHKMIHSGEKPFQCDECGKRFRQFNKLKIHCITHTDKKPYICEICGKGFRFRNYLSVHKRLHSGENPYKCKFCSEYFHSLHSRRLHTKMMHCEAKTFTCPICDKILTAQCYLTAHLKRHTNQRDFKCETCEKCFFSQSQLKDHRLVHTNLKPHQCNVCNARFQRKSNYTQHLKIHTGEKKYVCDICQKSFAQNAGLYGHMKSHAKSS
uniref:C2H2-type domain-containing protein n=1 Tax=Stomoxys calcitrans TaxID=35570 RepID=A0A1I8PUJ2_STOCA